MPKRVHSSAEHVQAFSPFPPQYKRRCLDEPDCKVIVGGVEFHHHSFILCFASEYFDTMLSSGMQEAQNKVIEFPDKDPEEWKLVYPFLEPRSVSTSVEVKITKENAKAVLPWFHEFGLTKLLQESDEKLWSSLLLFKHGYHPHNLRSLVDRQNILMEVFDWAATADMYCLNKTREAMTEELKKAVNYFPELITKELLTNMLPFFSKTGDTELWEAVKSRLPSDVKDGASDDTLKSNPLFIDLLSQSFKIATLEKNQKESNPPPHQAQDDSEDEPHRDHFRRGMMPGWRQIGRRFYAAHEEAEDDHRPSDIQRRLLRRRAAAAEQAEEAIRQRRFEETVRRGRVRAVIEEDRRANRLGLPIGDDHQQQDDNE
jgi:hypothetical protein